MSSIKLAFCAGLLVASIGCGKNETPSTSETKAAGKETKVEPTPVVPPSAEAPGGAALQSAKDFLKAVQDEKATSASLTAVYKKLIAPPELEADKVAGYSESGVQAWLASIKTKVIAKDLKADFASADFAICTGGFQMTPGAPGKTYLRMVRYDKTWLIDYAIVGSAMPFFAIPNSDQSAIAFAALAFGEALSVRNDSATEALLTKGAKAKLAPPLFDTDKEQGYSKSKLKSSLSYLFPMNPILKGLSVTGNTAKMEVQVEGGSGPLSYKLIPGTTPGEYLVDEFPLK